MLCLQAGLVLKLWENCTVTRQADNLILDEGHCLYTTVGPIVAGYSGDMLEHLYTVLHGCMEETQQRRFGIVVGGDFNTQLNIGFREMLLNDLVAAFDLQIANDYVNHQPDVETWTFEGSTGIRRRIEFSLFSAHLPFLSGSATSHLDMGSDHRAVSASFTLTVKNQLKPKHKPFKANNSWTPTKTAENVKMFQKIITIA